jgi:hypothetical protein
VPYQWFPVSTGRGHRAAHLRCHLWAGSTTRRLNITLSRKAECDTHQGCAIIFHNFSVQVLSVEFRSPSRVSNLHSPRGSSAVMRCNASRDFPANGLSQNATLARQRFAGPQNAKHGYAVNTHGGRGSSKWAAPPCRPPTTPWRRPQIKCEILVPKVQGHS